MKHAIQYVLFILSFVILSWPGKIYAQDVIKLKNTNEFIECEIFSNEKKHIYYYPLNEVDRKIRSVNKKYILWYRFDKWSHPHFSFSFSVGAAPYGTSTSLKKYMNDNGYSGGSAGFFGTVSYPNSTVKISYSLEIEYKFHPPHGFSIAFSNTNSGLVEGSGSPKVYYRNPQLLLFYKSYTKSYRTNFQVGPILNFNHLWYERPSGQEPQKTSLGIMVGMAFSLTEKESFFMRFVTRFKYVPPITTNGVDEFLENEKIGLSNIHLGLQFGFKTFPK